MNTTATAREVAKSQRGDSAVATATPIVRYVHPDNLGSTAVTSDANGNLAQWFDYAPYGTVLASENTGTTTAARQYIGQFSDASGLSYLNARYYNGSQGQFTSEDPTFLAIGNPNQIQQTSQQQQNQLLMDPQSLNSYSYSRDNHIIIEDPSGKWYQQFLTGQQSWPSFQLELGDAANELSQESPSWNFAFDHPYASGAVTGLLAVPVAESGTAAVAAFGAAAYPGVGAAYAAQQAFAGTVYAALSLGAVGGISDTFNSFSQVNFTNPSSIFPAGANLTVQVAPAFAGDYVNALSDIYQLVSLIGQEITQLTTSSQSTGSNSSHPSNGGASSGGSSGGANNASTPANLHTACGTLCL
jgi:RHS repeat-associated protein